jgi:hypothetical protein
VEPCSFPFTNQTQSRLPDKVFVLLLCSFTNSIKAPVDVDDLVGLQSSRTVPQQTERGLKRAFFFPLSTEKPPGSEIPVRRNSFRRKVEFIGG